MGRFLLRRLIQSAIAILGTVTLNAFEIPLPEGEKPPFDVK